MDGSARIACLRGARCILSDTIAGRGDELSLRAHRSGAFTPCRDCCLASGALDVEALAAESRIRPLDGAELGEVEVCFSPRDEGRFVVAVDLGTSLIRVSVCDLDRRERVGAASIENPQSRFGVDVLCRISVAANVRDGRRALSNLARAAVIRAVRGVGGDGVLARVARLVVVGNTAMLALLSEEGVDALLEPTRWSDAIECAPRDHAAWTERWRMPGVEASLAAPVSGFVGSDLLAAVYATRLCEGPAGSTLIDAGTNAEVAVWDGDALHVSSVAGGPAFEEGDGEYASTRVSRVASALASRALRPSGRAVGEVHPSLTPAVLDAIQRAKAAAAAATLELLDRAEHRGAIPRLCLCGTLARHLDVGDAQRIGLLPSMDRARVELHPDAALVGCERAALSRDGAEALRAVTRRARAVNLGGLGSWDERYFAQLTFAPFSPWRAIA